MRGRSLLWQQLQAAGPIAESGGNHKNLLLRVMRGSGRVKLNWERLFLIVWGQASGSFKKGKVNFHKTK